jgi:hypothetical protein
MIAAQHTPGPWVVIPQKCHNGDIATVYNTTEGWVSIHAPSWVNIGDQKVAMANARLICASPDLLAELKKARAFIEVDRKDLLGSMTVNGELKADDIDLRAIAEYNDILASIDAAMTKAEGGAA